MTRHHPPLFEQTREVIEPVLERLGFSLAEERYDQRSFGSAMATYYRPGFPDALRLIWDGREGALYSDYDAGLMREERIEWQGPAVRTAAGVPSLLEAIKARFQG